MEQAERSLPFNVWDWDIPSKPVADVDVWHKEYSEVQELIVSEDGERVAAIVKSDDDVFTVCVNEEPWESTFEKVWSLRFAPDGKLTCIGMNEDEWTIIQDDRAWDDTFEYVWNLKFSHDGTAAAANIRTSAGYGIILNGHPWESAFIQMRACEISADGTRSSRKRPIKTSVRRRYLEIQAGGLEHRGRWKAVGCQFS